jgi:hypothetical protein
LTSFAIPNRVGENCEDFKKLFKLVAIPANFSFQVWVESGTVRAASQILQILFVQILFVKVKVRMVRD